MNEYKSVEKYLKKQGKETSNSTKQEEPFHKYLISFVSRVLFAIIIFLVALIGCKNPTFKSFVNEQVYHTNFQFASLKEWYQKNVGNIIPLDTNLPNSEPVFSEQLFYQSKNLYKDGVQLKVGEHYLVPILESGIVVFMGEKEGYGNTIVIQQVNGVDLWYCNITSSDLKLYDYVEKGNLLGESLGEDIYLVFEKEGEFLNYQDYLE